MSGKYKSATLHHSSSPSRIVNAQHHDLTGTQKAALGSPLVIKSIVAGSSAGEVVGDAAIIRVMNTDSAVQYIWVGLEEDAPNTVDSTTGIPLPVGIPEVFYLPSSNDDTQEVMVKTSDAKVHITVMEC